jgi:hypothetical protein
MKNTHDDQRPPHARGRRRLAPPLLLLPREFARGLPDLFICDLHPQPAEGLLVSS